MWKAFKENKNNSPHTRDNNIKDIAIISISGNFQYIDFNVKHIFVK